MAPKRARAMPEPAPPAVAPTEEADAALLGPLPGLTGYVLRRAQLFVFQDFIDTCARHDIRPAQYSVLTVIEHSPGLNQSRLAGLLGIKRANLVGMLDELEARGLAERRQRDDDRRAWGLHLSAAGARMLADLHELVGRHEARMVERLGMRGKEQLLALLRQLADDSAAEPAEDAD